MTTPNAEIGAITTTTLHAIARAADGCAVGGQPRRAFTIALDVEPLPWRRIGYCKGSRP